MSSSFTTSSTSPPHYTLQCRACNKPITFDDRRTSQRTGKKIPLDTAINEPHSCPVLKVSQKYQSQQQQQPKPQTQTQQQQQKGKRYVQCSKGCGSEIYFDVNQRTGNGKWIPLDKDTGQPHQCPNQPQQH